MVATSQLESRRANRPRTDCQHPETRRGRCCPWCALIHRSLGAEMFSAIARRRSTPEIGVIARLCVIIRQLPPTAKSVSPVVAAVDLWPWRWPACRSTWSPTQQNPLVLILAKPTDPSTPDARPRHPSPPRGLGLGPRKQLERITRRGRRHHREATGIIDISVLCL